MDKNLLKETIEFLKSNGKTLEDVLWAGNLDGTMKISKSKISEVLNVEYDSGYGGQEIASDLCLVGKDWWIERKEYDGSEWWEYKTIPILKSNAKETEKVLGRYWNSLEDIKEGWVE